MHHAYLYVGDLDAAKAALPLSARTEGADTLLFVSERFGVDEARRLTDAAVRLPFASEKRHFVVVCSFATIEAQNALLKTLEEPAPTSVFHLIVPREDVFIETVRSRLMRVSTEAVPGGDQTASDFLGATYAKRLEEIAERTKQKDDAWIETVMEDIERFVGESVDAGLCADVILTRRFLALPGASKKMLLEHLALSIPECIVKK